MHSVNDVSINNIQDTTAAVFDTFYSPVGQYPVEASLYDEAVAYFVQQSRSPVEARRLTDLLFRVADASGVPPVQIFEDIKARRNSEIENALNFYINQVNSRSTLQGLSTNIQSNFFVSRTVLE